MSAEAEEQLADLKRRIAALRTAVPQGMLMEMVEVLTDMERWLVTLDCEIDDLDSRMHYFEEHDYIR